jgi:hypothetical protein
MISGWIGLGDGEGVIHTDALIFWLWKLQKMMGSFGHVGFYRY